MCLKGQDFVEKEYKLFFKPDIPSPISESSEYEFYCISQIELQNSNKSMSEQVNSSSYRNLHWFLRFLLSREMIIKFKLLSSDQKKIVTNATQTEFLEAFNESVKDTVRLLHSGRSRKLVS